MNNWVLMTILYSLIIGFYTCCNKKAMKKTNIIEVLAFFSLLAFLLAAVTNKGVFDINYKYLYIIFIKALIIAATWFTAGLALKKLPISLYAVLNLSKILFTIALSIFILGEKLTVTTFIGSILVIIGLLLVNKRTDKENNVKASLIYIILLLLSCLLSSIASIIDKKILYDITSSQLQFWFLLFFTLIMWIVLLIRNKEIDFKSVKKNYWIILMAIILVVADKFLLKANQISDSKVIVMTIVRQLSTIEVIVLGKIMFKEKKVLRKLLCSLIIIAGIIITLI